VGYGFVSCSRVGKRCKDIWLTLFSVGQDHLVLQVDFCVFLAIYIGQASHFGIVIILLILLKAMIAKLFGGKASIIILEIILNIQKGCQNHQREESWSPIFPKSKTHH
jgi:hypothetical protein